MKKQISPIINKLFKHKQKIQMAKLTKINLNQQPHKVIIGRSVKVKKIVFTLLDNKELKLFKDFCDNNAFEFTILRLDTKTNRIEICCEKDHYLNFLVFSHNQK